MVNNSININKTNIHPSPQDIENQKNHDIWRWKSRSSIPWYYVAFKKMYLWRETQINVVFAIYSNYRFEQGQETRPTSWKWFLNDKRITSSRFDTDLNKRQKYHAVGTVPKSILIIHIYMITHFPVLVLFVCLMVVNATFTNIFPSCHGGQFYWGMKPEKTLSHTVVLLALI